MSLIGLLRRALADPVSIGSRAWAVALAFVILDGFSLPFLVLDDPDPLAALTLSAVAALGYVIAGGWLVLARLVGKRVPNSWSISLLAWALVGLTWGSMAVAWSLATGAGSSAVEAVGTVPVLVATTAMSVVFACFVAIVLHAHQLARAASAEARAASRRYRSANEQMAVVQMNARLGFRTWLEDVLQPAIAQCQGIVQGSAPDAASRIDAVREQVVRVASRRLHPRTVALGPRSALGCVLLAHGLADADRVNVRLDEDPPAEVTGCLARCLDVLLTGHRGGDVSVTVTRSTSSVRMEVVGVADSAVANAPEVLARVNNLDGTVHVTSLGITIDVPVTHRDLEVAQELVTVRSSHIDVAVLVGIALTLLTGIVIALLDGHPLPVLVACLAAAIGSCGLRLLSVERVVKGASLRARIAGGLGVLCAAVAISALVTTAWWASSRFAESGNSLVTFWLANTVVVATVIVIVALIAARVETWNCEVDRARQMSSAALLAARTSIRDVDRFREDIASVLHSQVQARLIVACGRLENPRGPDIDGARRALAMVHQVDLPELRRITEGDSSEPGSLTALAGTFADVELQLHIDEAFPAEGNGPVVEVVREAIVNAVRHGGASCVRVKVRAHGNDWLVTVADDGLGPRIETDGGLGLMLVDAASGGRWNLTRDPGGGALLTARVVR